MTNERRKEFASRIGNSSIAGNLQEYSAFDNPDEDKAFVVLAD